MTRISSVLSVLINLVFFSASLNPQNHFKEQWDSLHPQILAHDINQHQIMYQQFLINLIESTSSLRQESEDKIQALQRELVVMKEQNVRNLNEISSLFDKIKAADDWKTKYEDIADKYKDTSSQLDNIMHKVNLNLLTQQKNEALQKLNTNASGHKSYQIPLFAVAILILLSIIGVPIYRCIMYNISKEKTKTSLCLVCRTHKQNNLGVISEQKATNPDPLGIVIVMNETPPVSRPQTPKSSTQFPNSSTVADYSSHDLIFEEEDVKMTEIPDTIR